MIYLPKNGKNYWFEFTFQGVRHRQSCKTASKEVATKIEREHRRALELGQVGLFEKQKPKLFEVEVKAFIALMQPHWATETRKMHNCSLPAKVNEDGTITYGKGKLLEFFGKMDLADITATHIHEYQLWRSHHVTKYKHKHAHPSNRTINIELTTVRQLLDHHKLWLKLREGSKLKTLKERKDVGRALDEVELQRLLEACRASNSRALYTAVLLSLFTGLRSFELRNLKWKQIDLLNATVTVGKSKTTAGEGRVVNLSESALELITNWRGNFEALPQHYVFPSEQYSCTRVCRTFPDRPYTSFYGTWNKARKAAGVECRWHDLRHSCASIVGGGGATRETLKALFGWMSDKMLERYIHSAAVERKTAIQHIDSVMMNVTKKDLIQ
jgi:integrase